jgi:hypothetical protein
MRQSQPAAPDPDATGNANAPLARLQDERTLLGGWLVSEQGGIRWLWNILKFPGILAGFWMLSHLLSRLTGQAVARIPGASGLLWAFLVTFVRQAVLERIVAAHPLVIRLHQLADSAVNFVVRPWAKTGDYWPVYWDLTRAVKREFDTAGITIPFPQRDVHLHSPPGAGS